MRSEKGLPGNEGPLEQTAGWVQTDSSRRLGAGAAGGLFLLALVVLLPGIQVSLFDRDEGWYAQVCREMVASGDWLVPRYLGEVWLAKPPLIYWLVAASYKLLGIGEWQARLVPVLATSINVVLVALLGARMFGRRVGVLAGVLFITAGLPAIVGKMLLTDAVMLLCTLAAVLTHWDFGSGILDCRSPDAGDGVSDPKSEIQNPKSNLWKSPHSRAFAYWFFIGLGVLAKGPATLVFAGAFALALLTTPGRRAWLWNWRFWACLPVAVMVAAPWYIYMNHVAGGTLFQQFFGYEIADRIAGTPHGHGGPPGYYLLLSLAGLLPWTALIPGTLIVAFRRRKQDLILRLLMIWLTVPWIVLELIHSKLPHYILPCYVPLFLLLAAVLSDSLRPQPTWASLQRAEQRVLELWARVPSGIGVGLVLMGLMLLTGIVGRWHVDPHVGIAAMISGFVLVVGFGLSARLMRHLSLVSAGIGAIVSMLAFHVSLGTALFPSLEPRRLSRNLAAEINRITPPGEPVYLCGYDEPSTYFYLRDAGRRVDAATVTEWLTHPPTSATLAITERTINRLPLEAAEQLKAQAHGDAVVGTNYVKMSSETIRLIRFSPR